MSIALLNIAIPKQVRTNFSTASADFASLATVLTQIALREPQRDLSRDFNRCDVLTLVRSTIEWDRPTFSEKHHLDYNISPTSSLEVGDIAVTLKQLGCSQ